MVPLLSSGHKLILPHQRLTRNTPPTTLPSPTINIFWSNDQRRGDYLFNICIPTSFIMNPGLDGCCMPDSSRDGSLTCSSKINTREDLWLQPDTGTVCRLILQLGLL
ncbi:hypothetical protein ASPCADRAFT_203794 [Aspergillus carbonarius ITEM 5010]|uniref:Uncharacterized protein n=1 Tax=Aspergillus carbonarius (strain ITEM 5010) TaxID=602072 RepID=A0A1R3RZH4_ASPC5|nr:hypothetical protein ASPCADRAFT_203794 [Aspergillus carbonarius ITEM 5010]